MCKNGLKIMDKSASLFSSFLKKTPWKIGTKNLVFQEKTRAFRNFQFFLYRFLKSIRGFCPQKAREGWQSQPKPWVHENFQIPRSAHTIFSKSHANPTQKFPIPVIDPHNIFQVPWSTHTGFSNSYASPPMKTWFCCLFISNGHRRWCKKGIRLVTKRCLFLCSNDCCLVYGWWNHKEVLCSFWCCFCFDFSFIPMSFVVPRIMKTMPLAIVNAVLPKSLWPTISIYNPNPMHRLQSKIYK